MIKIYFIASFGNFDKLPLGGGQTAARRLLSTLKNLGYNVQAIHRHPPTAKNRMVRGVQFGSWLILDLICVFFRLLFRTRKNTMTLYMGYLGGIMIPLEYLMSSITRNLGYKNVLYLAGGGAEKVYNQSSRIARYFTRKTLSNYKLIMTEGLDSISFVQGLSSSLTFYLPNYTEDGFSPSKCPEKPKDKWNVIYFGRIVDTKNILLCIDVFNILCEKYKNISFTIVGGGDEDYCKSVEKIIEESPFKEKIKRVGRSTHEELKKMMYEQHFFLFPSNEPREGHSNSLNEAMGFGLVPIVSDNNFLPSIVSNNCLIVHEMTSDAYASVIMDIIDNGKFDTLSKEMYDRVQTFFVQSVVEKKLKERIDTL